MTGISQSALLGIPRHMRRYLIFPKTNHLNLFSSRHLTGGERLTENFVKNRSFQPLQWLLHQVLQERHELLDEPMQRGFVTDKMPFKELIVCMTVTINHIPHLPRKAMR